MISLVEAKQVLGHVCQITRSQRVWGCPVMYPPCSHSAKNYWQQINNNQKGKQTRCWLNSTHLCWFHCPGVWYANHHYAFLFVTKVGSYLKTPRYPVWLVCSESHFSVLFGLQRELLTSQDEDLEFDLYYYDGLANQQEEIRLTVCM